LIVSGKITFGGPNDMEQAGHGSSDALFCPACGGPIPSRWILCRGCGRVAAAARSFRKRHLLFLTAIALLFLSLIIRVWIRF
jgi:predicted nucleic acid-binding Zn ribbon protein